MDVGTLLSVVQTLFASLQCSELKQLYSISAYKSELENLGRTVGTIKAVLADAESKQVEFEFSEQVQLWIEELKDALYDADDLVDEFVTLAEQKKLNKDDNLFQKVKSFFSRLNSVAIAKKMSKGVKEIRKRLDVIASNHNQFGFKLDCQPIRKRREETCSYVHSHDIIGRKDDVDCIVDRLLDPRVQKDVSSLAIVGIGGLGKTTLAQLVYNDERVKENFPLRLWTCVGDLDTRNLDVKATLCKILHSATSQNPGHLSMDHLQKQLHKQLAGKKYFLVLDDLWNEVRDQWVELEKFLMSGLKGSRILVTTRSQNTAVAIGDKHPYDLKGLSREDSWCLFAMAAFGEKVRQVHRDLVTIGKNIVERCANNPLAIKVVGSLLYGRGKDKWSSVLENMRLGTINKSIHPIFKLSYHNLETPLKTCFSYCAIFPKDHRIEKEMLIRLWIAQGFVIPLDEGQSIEDASEEYFSILLKRCFFQDVTRDENGEIVAFKIHDLLHDITEEVIGKEILNDHSIERNLVDKVRHIFFYSSWGENITNQLLTCTKIRTCIYAWPYLGLPLPFDTIRANWKCLRALSLNFLSVTKLPRALGEQQHLRYLDLSENRKIQVLPNSIAKLYNLVLRLESYV